MPSYDIEIPEPLIWCTSKTIGEYGKDEPIVYAVITVGNDEVWRSKKTFAIYETYVAETYAEKHLRKTLGKLLEETPED